MITQILCFVGINIASFLLIRTSENNRNKKIIRRLKQQLKYSNDAYYQLEQQDRCNRSELMMLKTDKEGSI